MAAGRFNIDQANIVLMLLSLGIAYAIPFELILLSYAFLGPAHYLTEISWLHDRSYFTNKKWMWVPLTVLTVIITIAGLLVGASAIEFMFVAMAIALCLSAGFAFGKQWEAQIILILGGIVALLATQTLYPPFALAFIILVPTVVHIYIFTGIFILGGALKSRSPWAFASLAVFILCGAFFFVVKPSTTIISNDFVKDNLGNFDVLVDYLVRVISVEGRINAHNILAFLSFAYTYHYLNWFSKVDIIKWHQIPQRRFVLIAALYLASIGIYMINFNIGFLVLSFLSLGHVLLEFPLNAVSIKMIFSGAGSSKKSAA